MLVEDVLQLTSHDALAQDTYDLDGRTVADILEFKDTDDSFYKRITDVMARERINLVPVVIVNDTLYEGHHRVKIADELGLEEVLCTDSFMDHDSYDSDEVVGEEEK